MQNDCASTDSREPDEPTNAAAHVRMAPATPLPWKFTKLTVEHHADPTYKVEGGGDSIMGDPGYYPYALGTTDAEYAVHACNCFPDLLAALIEIETICTESASDCRKRMGTRVGNTLVAAHAALAKARGES